MPYRTGCIQLIICQGHTNEVKLTFYGLRSAARALQRLGPTLEKDQTTIKLVGSLEDFDYNQDAMKALVK